MSSHLLARLAVPLCCASAVLFSPHAAAAPVVAQFSAIGFAVECEGSGPDPICQTTPLTGFLRYVDPDPLSSDSLTLCDPANITLANPSGCRAGTEFHLTYGSQELTLPLDVSDFIAVRARLDVIEFGNTVTVGLEAVVCNFFSTDPLVDPIGPGGCEGPFWRISAGDFFDYDSGHGERASGHIGWVPEPPTLALIGAAFAGLLTTRRRRA